MKCKCEDPQIIYNPYLKWLYCTRAVAMSLNGAVSTIERSPRTYYNFPWHIFSAHRPYVTEDTIDNYILYDAQDNAYPVFLAVPCGHCRLCRQHKVDDWMTRCMCETSASSFPPLFITLTYDPKHLPSDGVSKTDVQRFFKRLRRRIDYNLGVSTSLRYFLVAEYGKKTKRAHYHLLLWNMPYVSMREGDKNSFYSLWKFLRDAWQNGNIRVEYCRDSSGRYCMKYMRKECQVPKGKNDCFSLASRRPGIGFLWLQEHFTEYYKDLSVQSLSIRTSEGVQERPIPDYFKRKIWPTVSQLFPPAVSKALKEFMEDAAKLYHFSESMGYPYSGRIAEYAVAVTDKYGDIFPIDFSATGAASSWCGAVSSYRFLRSAFHERTPDKDMRESYIYDIQPRFGESDIFPYTFDYKISLRPLPDDKEIIVYKYNDDWYSNKQLACFRQNVIRMRHRFLANLELLMCYTFDEDVVQATLLNTRRHKERVRLLNECKDDPNIDALVHQYEVDRRWERVHWLEDAV